MWSKSGKPSIAPPGPIEPVARQSDRDTTTTQLGEDLRQLRAKRR
jgi:hypothetical protein